MDNSQNTIQFPSPSLQESTNRLWEMVRVFSDVMEQLVERNNSLGLIALQAKISQPELEKEKENLLIELSNLRIENDSLKNNLVFKEKESEEKSVEIENLKSVENLYYGLLKNYQELKSENRILLDKSATIPSLKNDLEIQKASYETLYINNEELKKKHLDFEELTTSLYFVREEVARKNHQLNQATEEILKLKNLNAEFQNDIYSAKEQAKEIDGLHKRIEELNSQLIAESEKTKDFDLMLERAKAFTATEHHRFEEELNKIKYEKSIIENDYNHLNDELTQIKIEKVYLENRANEEDSKIQHLLSRISDYQVELDNLNQQLLSAGTLIKELKNKDTLIDELNQQIADLNHLINSHQVETEDRINKISFLEEEITQKNNRINELELISNKIEFSEQHNIDLQKKLENDNTLIQNYENRIFNLDKEISELKENLTQNEANQTELMQESAEHLHQFNLKEKENIGLLSHVKELDQEIQALTVTIQNLVEESKVQKQNLLNSENESKQNDIEYYNSLLAEKENRIIALSQFESEYHRVNQELKDVLENYNQKQSEFTEINNLRISLESRNFSLTRDLERMKSEIANLQLLSDKLTKDVEELTPDPFSEENSKQLVRELDIQNKKISSYEKQIKELNRLNDDQIATINKYKEQLYRSNELSLPFGQSHKDDLIEKIEIYVEKLENYLKNNVSKN